MKVANILSYTTAEYQVYTIYIKVHTSKLQNKNLESNQYDPRYNLILEGQLDLGMYKLQLIMFLNQNK